MSDDDRFIYLVFTAQQRLRNYLKQALAKEGIKITPAQTGILALLLENNGRTMTELSQALSIDNSTITGLVDRLENAGFLKRQPKAEDRRISLIYITPEGDRETRKAIITLQEVNKEITSGFSTDEIEAFKRVLKSFFTKFNR
ncbi:MAG: MarR family transcriptional regulator [Deltaproteobacteria bacterium]|jgi:DNA-binding MarR family transcriptional regulator|nr:MarR family transcriptional regulator [Deltaproteobacteria bacterium]MBN2844380.1 MarR family transcriptional regulator [Deltaproteobacteria bacterium]